MKSNFQIKSFVEIKTEKVSLDLHNDFDFAGYRRNGESLEIEFIRSKGDWVNPENPKRLKFHFKNVSYFNEIIPADYVNDMTLSEITYFPMNDRAENSLLTDRETPNHDDDILFSFVNGVTLRINCCEIDLKLYDV